MQHQKSKPGPRGTSCLTCRQRRERCDLSRPFCGRCTKGSFECLGYDGDVGASKLQGTSRRSGLRKILPSSIESTPGPQQPIAGQVEPGLNAFGLQDTPEAEFSKYRLSSELFSTLNDPGASALEIGLLRCTPRTASVSQVNNQGDLSASAAERCFDSLWLQGQSSSIIASCSSSFADSPARNDIRIRPDPLDSTKNLCRIMRALCGSIPRSVGSGGLEREGYISYVLSRYLTQRVRKFFQPPPISFCHSMADRLKRSRATIWAMYLGAKLFQALDESSRDTAIQPYIHWINQCDQQVAKNTYRNPPIQEVEDRLTAQLELVFLKFVVFDCPAGYSLFQQSLPSFLRLVSADSNLCVEHCGNLVVSFSRSLAAPRYEVRRFVVYDTMLALVLGLAPLVEYGYEYGVAVECQPPLEWVHGIPVELLGSIAQVNAWRSGTHALVDDWQILEKCVLSWQPVHVSCEGEDDSAAIGIARLAVQESWRHVALIYLYMGMCGVSSHDPRVQSSVRQIVKLLEIASGSSIAVDLVVHCIVAGLAARYEEHRSILRAKLLSFQNNRIWFLPGTDFINVVERLWHNSGKDGGPVTWDEYVRSRCTIVPV